MSLSEFLGGRPVIFTTHWHPGHANPGDRLLHDASLQMFRRIGCEVRQIVTGDTPLPVNLDVPHEVVIAISGGGNLGGYYYPHDGLFGLRVADLYPRNLVVILPQTYVRPWDADALQLMSRVCTREYVYAFMRDTTSWYYFNQDYQKGWCEPDTVDAFYETPTVAKTADLLCVMREDAETHWTLPGEDWATWPYEELAERIGAYRRVVTDRLHVAILARKLGCEVFLLEGRYFKNESYYRTWWKGDPMVHLLTDAESIGRVLGVSAPSIAGRQPTPAGAGEPVQSAVAPKSEFATMVVPAEESFAERYAAQEYTGAGALVELGSWLGALTCALLRGLVANPNIPEADKHLHTYDIFIWEDWMDPYVSPEDKSKHGLYTHASFLPLFVQRIQPWLRHILIYAGDLCHMGWKGTLIEFLLVDAMKSEALCTAIVRDFYPALMVGRSLVCQQDFVHGFVPWIILLHYRFRDYFEWVNCLPDGTTAVFRYTKPLPSDAFTAGYGLLDFTAEEIENAFDYFVARVQPVWQKTAIAAAKVMVFVHQGDRDRALAVYQDLRRQGYEERDMLLTVKGALDGMRVVT